MAAVVMNRATFPKGLQEGLNTWFGITYNKYQPQWPDLYEVNKTKKAWEEDVMAYGLGLAGVKEEGTPVTYSSGGEAWNKIYRIQTVALAFAITQEALEDHLYGDLGKEFSMALADSFQAFKEVKAMEPINNATVGTAGSPGRGGDGVSLLNTAHPLAYGGTYSNTLSTPADLTEAALEDAYTLISAFTSEQGQPMFVQSETLFVHPSKIPDAIRITETPNRPGTADNDINAIRQMGLLPKGVKQLHYMTDTDMWFVKTNVRKGGRYFERVPLKTSMEGDFETDNVRYKGRERYCFSFTNPRWLVGSVGA